MVGSRCMRAVLLYGLHKQAQTFSRKPIRNSGTVVYLQPMPRKPIELPLDFARRFADDMRAYFAETNLIKRDEIAARQLHVLKQHYAGKLRLSDVKEMFLQMKDQ